MGEVALSNGQSHSMNGYRKSCWYEEEIEDNLRWCFALNSILHTGTSQYQDIALLDTKPFGKALVIDGKLQSAETDEFIYHECLVHPPLLHHPNPKNVFIMGGGEGSTARELLRHNTIDTVIMCDIDEEVVDFCKSYLVANREAFHDPRLKVIINDARAELESREERYDVIIGDLADPIDGGPCYKLYTKSFYDCTVKPRLKQGGIFVTQAGPAGIFSHTEVFSSIYNTLRQASDSPIDLSVEELDNRMRQRIKGENRYLDGRTFSSASTLSKVVRKSLDNETHVYTEEAARNAKSGSDSSSLYSGVPGSGMNLRLTVGRIQSPKFQWHPRFLSHPQQTGHKRKQQLELENLTITTQPLRTLKFFTLAIIQYLKKSIFYLLEIGGWLVLFVCVIGALAMMLIPTDGSHEKHLEELINYSRFVLWWVALGVASSIGLGSGLHTFVLYLGPHIVLFTIKAMQCGRVDLKSAPYDTIQFNSSPSWLDKECSEFGRPLFKVVDDGSRVPLSSILPQVQVEAVLWGIGTAIGELPPYFISRAARLSGSKLDAMAELDSEDKGFMATHLNRAKRWLLSHTQYLNFFTILALASVGINFILY
ncbi:hypothetical protein Ahy_A09g042342 isoform B [Arachis hypogaea]|uniref:thermospermine synthase n=1 Tax=Arachis hypogaea TaxID=3818 RepID=A0A445BFJ8_ARAHY|nr:hypothetical protein Ahy_A09g042342 isoform B [Arachis hypogaea]